MTSRPIRRPALALTLALVVGACGASTASPTAPGAPPAPESASAMPPATDAPTPEPVATAVPTAAATPSPTTTAAPAATPSPATGPVVGSPAGPTSRITLGDVGLRLTLPKGWQTVPLDADGIQEILDILPPGTLPAGFEDQVATLVASGLKLFALDVDKANRGANVTVLAVPTEIPEAYLRTTAEIGIAQVGGVKDVRYKNVKVDGEPALRVEYTLVLELLGKTRTSSGVQLWVPWDGATLAITVTTPKGGPTADRDALIRSLRLD